MRLGTTNYVMEETGLLVLDVCHVANTHENDQYCITKNDSNICVYTDLYTECDSLLTPNRREEDISSTTPSHWLPG